MKKIIITGAGGFLGGHIWSLARQRAHALGLYHRHRPSLTGFEQLDITDDRAVAQCIMAFQPDVIVHAAANANLDACEANPLEAYQVNVEGTKHLLQHGTAIGARFIFLSTDMVFDGCRGGYSENDSVSPLSVYGRSKVAAEEIIQQTAENYVIVRAALIYGRPRLLGSSFSQWIETRLIKGQAVPLYVDQFRTPILADNLAEIIIELAFSSFTGIIHCAGTNRISRWQFGRQLCQIGGYDATLLKPVSMFDDHPLAPRPQDVSLSTALAARIIRTPLLSTEEGLHRMLKRP